MKKEVGFVENTLVKTIDGYKEIKDIRIGDKVLTHRGRFREVYGVNEKRADLVYSMIFDADVEVFAVVCAKDSEFLTFEMKMGDQMIRAIDMNAYDCAIGVNEYDEEKGYELTLRVNESPSVIYSLMVEDDESYTVSKYNVVVCA